jgi:hypothetical protein
MRSYNNLAVLDTNDPRKRVAYMKPRGVGGDCMAPPPRFPAFYEAVSNAIATLPNPIPRNAASQPLHPHLLWVWFTTTHPAAAAVLRRRPPYLLFVDRPTSISKDRRQVIYPPKANTRSTHALPTRKTVNRKH